MSYGISLRHQYRMGRGGDWGKEYLLTLVPHLAEMPQTVFAAMNSRNFKNILSS